jgi:chloramphenicol-sensitive protein RarD
MWGLIPLYFRPLQAVPPFEFVGWRMLFTIPVCLVIVALRKQIGETLRALGNPHALGLMLLSAMLIGGNWLIYVWAVQNGHVLATSLGYYINPLVNVLVGTLFLHERLTRRQWIAVAIATVGVALLAWGAREMLGIAMALALTFASYGLVRRVAPVGSLQGLTIETMLLALPAAGVVVWQSSLHGGSSFGKDVVIDLLILLSGVVSAVPLLLFAEAARRLDFSTLGFIQFLAPTLVFFLGLFVFHEPLNTTQLACFVLIWIAAGVFIWDLVSRRRNA